jgi:protein SCO1/2
MYILNCRHFHKFVITKRCFSGNPEFPQESRLLRLWKPAMFTLATCAAVLYAVKFSQARANAGPMAITHQEVIGKPRLGGDWTLVNAKTGELFTRENLKGKFSMLYFGFSFCPDVCPQEMEKIVEVEKILKEKGIKNFQPVFITVDPKRDTCAQLDNFIKDYGKDYIALTGTPEMIKHTTRLYRVYFNQNVNQNGGEDYLVDHSIIHYLLGPDGNFIDFYGKNFTATEIADKVLVSIASYHSKLSSCCVSKLLSHRHGNFTVVTKTAQVMGKDRSSRKFRPVNTAVR